MKHKSLFTLTTALPVLALALIGAGPAPPSRVPPPTSVAPAPHPIKMNPMSQPIAQPPARPVAHPPAQPVAHPLPQPYPVGPIPVPVREPGHPPH